MGSKCKWTLDKLRDVASKYSYRRQFYDNDRGAYDSALRRGLLNEICKHMETPKRFREELVGQKFNLLTVCEYLGANKTKNNIYRVKCECGKEKIYEGSDIKQGKVKSCGCKRHKNPIKQDSIWKSIYRDYRAKAKQRGYDFLIDDKEFEYIIKSPCFYCGVESSNRKFYRRKQYDEILEYNGIDRVDNKIGYISGNCVPCCIFCNQAKHGMTKEFFLDWVDRVYKFQNKELNEEERMELHELRKKKAAEKATNDI